MGTTTAGQSGSGSNGNEEVLHIPEKYQNWSLINRWFSVISKTLIEVGKFYSPAEMQSLYSTAPADWAVLNRIISVK